LKYLRHLLVLLLIGSFTPSSGNAYWGSRNVNMYCYLSDPSTTACLVFRNNTNYFGTIQVTLDGTYGCSTGTAYCSIPVKQGNHRWSARASTNQRDGSWGPDVVDVPSTGCELDLVIGSDPQGCA
jgi:hypothetical protein